MCEKKKMKTQQQQKNSACRFQSLGTCWGHFENPLESLGLNLMGILCELFGNLVGTL